MLRPVLDELLELLGDPRPELDAGDPTRPDDRGEGDEDDEDGDGSRRMSTVDEYGAACSRARLMGQPAVDLTGAIVLSDVRSPREACRSIVRVQDWAEASGRAR